MPVEIIGDSSLGREILEQIQHWDQAVINKDIDQIADQCADDVSMFDVSSQMNGIEEYKTEWYKFSPYFNENMKISRKEIKVSCKCFRVTGNVNNFLRREFYYGIQEFLAAA